MIDRDMRGRFATGHGGAGGRPREEWRKALHKALVGRYTPDKLLDMLDTAERLFIEQKSGKGLVSIVVEVRDTLDGKPVQRVENVETDTMTEFINDIAAKISFEEHVKMMTGEE